VTNDQPELNKALLNVSERMEKLTPANMRKENVRRQLQQKGLPVMVQNLGGGRYRVEEILAVEQKPVEATLFVVPQDYAKTTGRDALKNIPGRAALRPARRRPQRRPRSNTDFTAPHLTRHGGRVGVGRRRKAAGARGRSRARRCGRSSM
jgi:hypothetical protein